ncbi:GNAT family N-acetyltransferase [Marinicella meishanensis]|uniref:GNAT family N-acetyltransferase n=1 Tax=Marinicella meishanensis TaxID=2873263 RepID=UPI001CBBE9B3|nr:GNAT family N-acetyltransferase [Marinicella sp. NBU2979]
MTEVVSWRFQLDGLDHPQVRALLQEHQDRMADHSPPESRHVLDVDGLKQPAITFWSLWDEAVLLGCVALKHWDDQVGEIKSMKTAPQHTGKGVGRRLMQHILQTAHERGYQELKLETGSMAYFEPARRLYRMHGFVDCGPFGHYQHDPNSVFMQLRLTNSSSP